MSTNNHIFDHQCYKDCEASYTQCMNSREHESVCNMKRAQCSCGCVLS